MQIHQIRSTRANSYIIEEDERLLVVDVPFMGDGAVASYLTGRLGRQLVDVELIVCTHGHADHLGGARSLADLCRAPVYVPPLTRTGRYRLLSVPARLSLRRAKSQSADGGWSGTGTGSDFTTLTHGCALPGFEHWEVIHTPGHTDDSCCYFHQPSRSLISGDTLLGSGRTKRLVLPAFYRDRAQLDRSVAALAELNPHAVYPGHGVCLEGKDLLAGLVRNPVHRR